MAVEFLFWYCTCWAYNSEMCIGCINRQEKVVLFLYLTGDFTPLWCKTLADPKNPMASRRPKIPWPADPTPAAPVGDDWERWCCCGTAWTPTSSPNWGQLRVVFLSQNDYKDTSESYLAMGSAVGSQDGTSWAGAGCSAQALAWAESAAWAGPGLPRAARCLPLCGITQTSLIVSLLPQINKKKKCVCVGESKYTVQINFSRNFILSRALFTLHPPTPPNHVGHAVLPERSSFRSGLNGWFKMKSRGEGGHLWAFFLLLF